MINKTYGIKTNDSAETKDSHNNLIKAEILHYVENALAVMNEVELKIISGIDEENGGHRFSFLTLNIRTSADYNDVKRKAE